MSAHTHTRVHKHSRHDKIINVLHCCVQDLTMWESDLLVRVCSGCCCNQHSPKAKPSHRKSSASSAATSCLCGKPRGEPGEWDSISVAPDLISCAAVAAAITPSASLHRSPSDVFPLEFKNEWKHALLKATYPAYGRRWAHTPLALIEKQWENSFIFQRE